MKKTVKLIAAALALAIALSTFPVSAVAVAAQTEYLEVVIDEAPIREDCYKTGKVVARCTRGAVLESSGTITNKHSNTWYRVEYNGKERYIYSENVRKHNHNYQSLELENIKVKICKNCGEIAPGENTSSTYMEYVKLATTALPVIDGALPVGDIIAAILVAYSVAKFSQAMVPVAADIIDQIREIDFSEYLRKRAENSCTPYTFRRVVRFPGGLKYLDSDCMDYAEAFVWTLVFRGDVYTASEDAALILASMSPNGSICERDKDKISYFYHYHLSQDRSEKAHVFFGTNDLGDTPI